MPESSAAESDEFVNDLTWETVPTPGRGIQTGTSSGVRVTHVPTGTQAESTYYKSQLRNKEEALTILRLRLAAKP